MRPPPHSSYHLTGDLDIRYHNYITRQIFPNGKSHAGIVFGSVRTFKQRTDLVWVREDFPQDTILKLLPFHVSNLSSLKELGENDWVVCIITSVLLCLRRTGSSKTTQSFLGHSKDFALFFLRNWGSNEGFAQQRGYLIAIWKTTLVEYRGWIPKAARLGDMRNGYGMLLLQSELEVKVSGTGVKRGRGVYIVRKEDSLGVNLEDLIF